MRVKIIFSLIAFLLLISLAFCSCGGEEEANVIKIGVIGPMTYMQGEHNWYGAQMARDEINEAGGIVVDGEKYTIELVQSDSNEMTSPTDATAAMERLITVDKVDFVVGGFRTEAVLPMQDIAMDNKTIFLGCGAADAEINARVAEDYDRYKYWFRVTPFCNVNMVNSCLMLLGTAGAVMQQGLGIEKIQVAILAEGAQWADGMVAALEAYIPASLGMEVVGTWRPSPTATDLTAELTAIEDSGAHVIMTVISGPIGIPYSRQLGELEIPAASVGINVEAQNDAFWDTTAGYGNYETVLSSYAKGVAQTENTVEFYDTFVDKFDETPTYNAATYDAIKLLMEAIERAGTLDSDAVVVELEKTNFVGTGGRIVFTGKDTDTPHDLTYGPGYATGIATQWVDGEQKCVWPWDWDGLTYEGTVMWQIPDRVIAHYTE